MRILQIDKAVRPGLAIPVAVILTAVLPGELAARHMRHHTHQQVQTARAELVQPSNIGAMRYYGGPKSPMWREVDAQTTSVQTTSASSGTMRYYGGPKSPMWRQ
jgi:hypothetical protein